jgi:hypothetical protein
MLKILQSFFWFTFLKTRAKVEIGCLFYHAFTCESSMYRAGYVVKAPMFSCL